MQHVARKVRRRKSCIFKRTLREEDIVHTTDTHWNLQNVRSWQWRPYVPICTLPPARSAGFWRDLAFQLSYIGTRKECPFIRSSGFPSRACTVFGQTGRAISSTCTYGVPIWQAGGIRTSNGHIIKRMWALNYRRQGTTVLITDWFILLFLRRSAFVSLNIKN